MMAAVCTSETSVYYETIRCCIPEDCPLQTHRREYLKSHMSEYPSSLAVRNQDSRPYKTTGKVIVLSRLVVHVLVKDLF
jgi:hypothetical protein